MIGARGSKLSLVQTHSVAHLLEQRGAETEVIKIKTLGDTLDVALTELGGKGVFVKEIEEALLRGDIDLAVHSMKDMPAEFPDGLIIVAIPPRQDPRDALISIVATSLAKLPKGARVGTSSPRRRTQLLHLRPDLDVQPMRGNVETRLKKLEDGQIDAIILAAAGLNRLGISRVITELIPTNKMIPAIGQGALCIEARADDHELNDFVAKATHHRATAIAIAAERAVLKAVGGDCHTPVAAYAEIKPTGLVIHGYLANEEGTKHVTDKDSGPLDEAEEIGKRLAEKLLKKLS